MRALFIGGTGTISMSITKLLPTSGWDLTLLNRGNHNENLPEGVHQIIADINDESTVCKLLEGQYYDVVADFIAFVPEQVERDIRLFRDHCDQYIFISSASAYQKPLSHFMITESTPLLNPHWAYSRAKIACEELLVRAYRDNGFNMTIVRPSHTYADGSIPLSFHSPKGVFTDLMRMKEGKPIIVHGDGNTLWTVTHSTDFAKGFVGLMGNIHAYGHAVHITSDESLTWNQIYESIGRAMHIKPQIVHVSTDMLVKLDPSLDGPLNGDKSHSVVFDNSKIKSLVPGFCATVRFDQGIRQSIDALFERPELQIFDEDWNDFLEKVLALYNR
jgi:nucleoside-diphosphate-sugar epimerase